MAMVYAHMTGTLLGDLGGRVLPRHMTKAVELLIQAHRLVQ